MISSIKSILRPIVMRVEIFVKYDIFNITPSVKYIYRILSKRKCFRRIYIFGSPFHTNLGDQAQTYCIEKWAGENIPDSEIITMNSVSDFNILIIFLISKIAKKQDIIICHSGYHFSERYPQYKLYEQIVKSLKRNPVIIFPQTVNFKNMKEALRVGKAFDRHPDCLLMCRDLHSYDLAKKIFKRTKLLLYPDIVTSLIGTYNFNLDKRDNILFCIRNDSESYYGRDKIVEFMKRFSPIKTVLSDTYSNIPYSTLIKNRRKILNETFEKFSRYKLIITDRYHGTIFSLISNTPAIVLGTNDHKLESGVKWFPDDEFKGYLYFAKDLEEAFVIAQRILKKPPSRKLTAYFKQKYYDQLLKKLNISNI